MTSICSIHPGFTARSRLEPAAHDGILAIQLRDITPEGTIDVASLARVNVNPVPGRYVVGPGDIVFRSRGNWSTASAIDNRLVEPALAVMPLFVLRPNTAIVDPSYLAWIINQSAAQRHFDSEAQGGSMRMVSKSSLERLEVDIPDLSIQRRLVAIDSLAHRERDLSFTLADKRRRLIGRRLAEYAQAQTKIANRYGARK